jgi:hypothetical protein
VCSFLQKAKPGKTQKVKAFLQSFGKRREIEMSKRERRRKRKLGRERERERSSSNDKTITSSIKKLSR